MRSRLAISLMGPIGQIGRIRRIRRIGRIREIGGRALPLPFFEGWKVRSPVSGVWSPYGRKTEEAEDIDADLQDGRSHAKKKRVESERFFIGFYKMLINRTFSRIKVSLLHSILVLQLLHLLA